MAGAELDRLDRGGDAGEAGQHDDQHLRDRARAASRTQARPERAAELQVDHRVARRVRPAAAFATSSRSRREQHLVAAPLERALQRARESRRRPRRSAASVRSVRHRVVLRSRASRAAASGARRRRLPARLRAVTLPPSLRATLTTRNRPRPPPGGPCSTDRACRAAPASPARSPGRDRCTSSTSVSPSRSADQLDPARARLQRVVEHVEDHLLQRRVGDDRHVRRRSALA